MSAFCGGRVSRRAATAVEGFPLGGDKRRSTGEAFIGIEPLFAARGFTAARRPTPARVVMRLDLGTVHKGRRVTASGTTGATTARRRRQASEE